MEKNKVEEIVDIEGSEHLYHSHGDRFLGWYFSKTFKEEISLPLNESGDQYSFKVCDYNYRFIMPPKIDFKGGLLTYSTADRELGVFRFPRNSEGDFIAPISLTPKDLTLTFSDEEAKEMLSMKPPVVFEAFKIPQYGFELFDIGEKCLQDIEYITDKSVSLRVKEDFESLLNKSVNEVLDRIKSTPNFLLILQNLLDKKLKDLNEVSVMTNKIIHI